MDSNQNSIANNYWAQFFHRHADSIVVEITGFQHFQKRFSHRRSDVFDWVTGDEINAFFDRHGLECALVRSSGRPNISSFYFPPDSKDVAALFKLTFA